MPSRTTTRTARTTRASRTRTRSMPAKMIPVAEGPTVEQIRLRAYEIYVARGAMPGDPEADWRQAEQELHGRMTLLGST